MKRTALLVVVALFAGILIGALATQAPQAQQSAITRTNLQTKDLAGVDGKEAVMYTVEIAPGGQSGRHYHPGTEIVYVTSGTGVLEIDGKSAVDFTPGAHVIIDPKTAHNAKNTGSAPLKVLVVAIHPKGEPPVVPMQ
jgi:quercetin dioxygenase-like cupin family protein